MDEQLKSNLTSGQQWSRLIIMLAFIICLQVASFAVSVLVILQFFFTLITGSNNQNLKQFADTLSQYIYQAVRYVTYCSEEKPFPFAPWPDSTLAEEGEVVDAEVVDADVSANEAEPDTETAEVALENIDEEKRDSAEEDTKKND